MADKNKNIEDMTGNEIIDEMASEFDRIYTHLLDNADKVVGMTDAEVWEHLIPPYQD